MEFSAPVPRIEFLPTPSTRRATGAPEQGPGLNSISTHALHEEGDWLPAGPDWCTRYFYPRPPRGGRRERLNKALG